jgi:hypothetical protein
LEVQPCVQLAGVICEKDLLETKTKKTKTQALKVNVK